jgi:hypothetical protein
MRRGIATGLPGNIPVVSRQPLISDETTARPSRARKTNLASGNSACRYGTWRLFRGVLSR